MRSLFYYIGVYIAVSGIGMYIANKKVTPQVKRQRWLKFFTYMLITATVIAGIFFGKLIWLAVIIISAASYELVVLNIKTVEKKPTLFINALLIFAIVATGFLYFSVNFTPVFQLFLYFQVFTFDAFCQITGQLFGKHVLSPKISPAKTVEGFIGGILFCVLSALLGSSWVSLSLTTAALIGCCTAFTAFSGDMLASYFKRLIKVKDYSNLLPGQGGFLDRFDSLIMTGALFYFFDAFFKLNLS